MKILQVTEFFTPSTGGSTQVVYQISRHLVRQGHQVTVCTSNFGKDEIQFPDLSFNIIRFLSLPTRWKFYVTPGLIPWTCKHLCEFDIIHMHNVRTFQNAAINMYAQKCDIPYFLSAHGSLPHLSGHHIVKWAIDLLFANRLLKEAVCLVAVSEVEVGQYLDAGIPKEKIKVINNGLDLEEFTSIPQMGTFRRKHNLTDKEKIILFLGRLHKIKGINHLIEAFANLRDRGINTVLVIAGPDDGELFSLQGMVRQLGLSEHVIFSGPLYGYDKLAAYVDAEVLVSPGVYEIFGLVPFEALMCGTPVIVTDNCGSGQLINAAKAGYLVPYGDVEALIKSILYVVQHPYEVRQKVDAGQKFIREHLDWDKKAIEIVNLYNEYIQ